MDYARQQRNPAKHIAGIAFVVAMHLLLVWGLQSGLARNVMSIIKKPIDAKLIEEPKPKEEPPPPPPPEAKRPPPPPPAFVLPAEVHVSAPAPSQAITAVTSAPPPPKVEAAPPPAKLAVRVAPVASAASCEKPEYPAASKRLEEEGTVVLNFLIGEDGLVKESKVQTSSGSARLDEAARAGLSKCKFKPGTVDGQPEKAWASMKYTWKLE